MFRKLTEAAVSMILGGGAAAMMDDDLDLQELELAEADLASGREGSQEHLFRLFVGWVPKLFSENDLKPLFDQWGAVRDIIVLKDKVTGQPRGCAFVSYATREEAEAAIRHLDRRVQLPGALNKLEVRFARSHQYIQAGAGPQDNRQLFFARAPPNANESDMWALFSQFGHVEDVNVFRERRTNQSKGCGFVTMGTRGAAVAAMQALDERHLMDGSTTPLAVKWADPDLQLKKRRAVEESNTDNRMLFFAKVLRSATEDEVRALFSRFGRIFEVNLFRAFQGAPTTKGCGLVTMGSNEEAAAAIEALDQKHVWEGMDAPMVVKWMDAALQKRRREEHLAAMRQGLVPSMAGIDSWNSGSSASGPSAPVPLPGLAAAGAAGLRAGGSDMGSFTAAGPQLSGGSVLLDPSAHLMLPTEVPPPGCAGDAYKLFVGNIPKAYTEEDLRPLFEAIGPIVELVVVRDKVTHESKGSAFVWYQSRADADRACLQLNVRHILPTGGAEIERPIVVRRANTRKPSAPLAYSAYQLQQQQQLSSGSLAMAAAAAGMRPVNVGMASGEQLAYVGATPQGMVMAQGSGQQLALQASPAGAAGMPMQQMVLQQVPGAAAPPQGIVPLIYAPMAAGSGGGAGGGALAYFQGPSDGGLMGVSSGGNVMTAGLMSGGSTTVVSTSADTMSVPSGTIISGATSRGATGLLPPVTRGQRQSSSGGAYAGDPQSDLVTLQVPVAADQMAAITGHVYSIQMMSGAEVTCQAIGPGVFCLLLSGGKVQVETANHMVSSVLQSQNIQ